MIFSDNHVIIPAKIGVQAILTPVPVEIQLVQPSSIGINIERSSEFLVEQKLAAFKTGIALLELSQVILITHNIHIEFCLESKRKALVGFHP